MGARGRCAVTAAQVDVDDRRPLIAHVVFSFDYGGLENGVANVINGLPQEAFRHSIIALTTVSGFRERVQNPSVTVHTIDKQPGKDPASYVRLLKLLRQLRPAIVHTRNLGTLEGAIVARLAGVPSRIHGEHGWDIYDPDGKSRKYRALRRFANSSITRFITVSRELETWLTTTVGIAESKVTRICNGVDTERFQPRDTGAGRTLLPADVFPPGCVAVASVTRFSPIKDPLNLVRAFIRAHEEPAGRALRLAMIGDGPLRADALRLLADAGLAGHAWLPGSRDDVAELLRDADLYTLASQREGISNTLLEAMASGLPVVATATGGNLELVLQGVTGRLVPVGDAGALAAGLVEYARDAGERAAHGTAARRRAEDEYSLRRMVGSYEALYRAYSTPYREVV